MLKVNHFRVWAVIVAAALVLAVSLLLARPTHAATFTVNSTADPGSGGCNAAECTLREAISATNANNNAPTIDTIEFKIPTTDPGFGSTTPGVFTILPTSELPDITAPLTINGYSQPGSKPNSLAVGNNAVLKIELSGAGAGSGTVGLDISATNSTVKGLVINRWVGQGVRISGSGATGNKVIGNFIGTDASGAQDLGNLSNGVRISGAPDNTIGGTTAGARNVISGNDQNGALISNAGATGNEVMGNYIGTYALGTKDLGNSGSGVLIENEPDNTIVGGTSTGARNVISGNDGRGVVINFAGTEGNKVMGNYIGTKANGTEALGNSSGGVLINGAPDNTVGGTSTGVRNVISGNDFEGVRIQGSSATGNQVTGNYVGTDKNGTADLGNSGSGVTIESAPDNTIGGTEARARNIISGNDFHGVFIQGSGATGNRILSNSIHTNSFLGINLSGGTEDANEVTANDTGDGDTGPNNLQNYPVPTSAKTTKLATTIKGTLNSSASTTFIIQFFSSPAPDPSGFGEGKKFKGQKSVTTDSSGNAAFTFKTRKKVPKGQVVTATATDQSTGDTSEFSVGKQVS